MTNERADALDFRAMEIDPSRPVPIYLQLKTLLIGVILERKLAAQHTAAMVAALAGLPTHEPTRV